MHRHVAGAVVAGLLALFTGAPRVAAQSSQMSATYTSLLTGSPVAADFQAGKVLAGFTDVAVTRCGRNPCTVRMNVPAASPGTSTLRYVSSAGLPALAACSTPVPTAAFPLAPVILTVAGGATASLRVYFCYDLGWTTSPPASFVPVVSFQLQNGL